jgi:hypothetical protein
MFYPCLLLVCLYSPVSHWSAFTFIMNTDSRKSADISQPDHRKSLGGLLLHMCVIDVSGKSNIYYPHQEGAQFLARHFYKENSRAADIMNMQC